MKSRIFPLLISLWFSCTALCISVRAERLPVRIYTSADGLGSGFVDYIMRDSRGFMWFCTRDGLSRFDGARLITYLLGDKDSPPGIEAITETSGGVYWISTTGGIFRFNGQSLSRSGGTRERPVLNAEYVLNSRGLISEDRAGNLWFQDGSNLFRMHERNGAIELEKTELPLPDSTTAPLTIFQFQEAPDQSLWISTNLGTVRRLPDGRVVLYEHPTDRRTTGAALSIDSYGYVWLVRGGDVYVIKPPNLETLKDLPQLSVQPLAATHNVPLEPEKQINLPSASAEILRVTRVSPNSIIRRMFVSADGHIWLTTGDRLLEFDRRVFHSFGREQGLLSEMTEMCEDAAGNLWVGGQSGLLSLNRRGLTTYRELDGLSSPRIYAIGQATDGAIWIANGEFYLSRFDGRGFTTTRPQIDDARSTWFSRYAFLSSANEWWILTVKGLYRFAATNLRTPLAVYNTQNGLKADEAFQIFEDSKGDIWLSQKPLRVEDSSLYRLKRKEDQFFRFTKAENFPEGQVVSSFAEDKNGNLWVSFYGGGIARFANNRFELVTNGLPEGLITDVHVDRKGRLWVATGLFGARRSDEPNAPTPTFVALTTNEGLSSNNIRTITEDKSGNIYLGTARGVDRISADRDRITHISVNDGLAGDFVVDSFCDRDGAVWFGTTNGVSRLVPTIDSEKSPPAIFLGGLRIAGEDQPVSELGDAHIQTADLSPTRNNLQIDFFGLDFRPGVTLKYQMMLEGADTGWSEPTELRTVTYANLKPGSYRFLVRAINADGLVSFQPATVSFRILPPIWLRWWFLTLAGLLAFALLYSFYRIRLTHLKQVNAALAEAKRAEEDLGRAREERLHELARVRTRIATDLHDDIGASLTQITILSEVARQQSLQGNGAVLEPLNSIVTVSNELVDTMSDIVWAINPEKDNLQNLVQRMRRFTSDLLTAQHIAFRFQVPTYAPEVPLGANARREVFLIFKESLTNVVKHAEATEVEISFEFSAEYLTLRVKDNGKGFDVQTISRSTPSRGGHGLVNMKNRVAELYGSLQVESSIGKGTSLTFRLPLEHAGSQAHGPTTQTDGDTRAGVS